ncbi:selenium cofactor biosynthesis protein YqeC [Yokenella regensburgei]|jgi:probable selenium-dependent hydroxylase accessory protein YqeC|uniref:selenium cofactor biosynthesis protein YqeC n=1 Tax=Yokenella regensburgei TaxID=158877 RepID=UPI00207722A5|nr:selenium cofactor biosynthesis protein YqeC [Yokenella regensburgei]MDQ4429478.1 selenium cofactor biosynthesis protein YqeC [Yokenella regensburgei]
MKNIPQTDDLFFDLNASSRPLVISAVGAGGKTSLLFWLATLLQQAGRRVLLTTTTHMFVPDTCPVLLCRDPSTLPAPAFQQPLLGCFSTWLPAVGKVRGFSPEQIDVLAARADVDVILVEADGAHGFALKAPNEHEPCIPQCSCCVIAVTGGKMLGQKVGPSNVHRWPGFSRLTGVEAGETLDVAALIRLVQHPLGAFKNVPEGCRRIWLINQYSQNENIAGDMLTPLLECSDVEAIWIGAVQEIPAITRRFVR